jgi:hypothetical protein
MPLPGTRSFLSSPAQSFFALGTDRFHRGMVQGRTAAPPGSSFAPFVCRESADFAALDLLSLCKAFCVARERLGDTIRLPETPLARSRSACFRTRLAKPPALGAPNFTPARRAFDKPIAIACCGDLAPCFPSRR